MAEKVGGFAYLDGMVSFSKSACWGQQLVAELGYALFGLLEVEKQSKGLLVFLFFLFGLVSSCNLLQTNNLLSSMRKTEIYSSFWILVSLFCLA
ncbi:hypothetical protein PRUPE_8G038600 [Prunus persica]|uniref:Uncharacterized protein n=1 Tax=Prunus persica TaxID=3760 RepID=A0A251MSL7_PRUPE|nr:hypothetical protein PRUPE_8G038600 [Prunus persica]